MISQIHKQQYSVNLEVNRLEYGAEMIMCYYLLNSLPSVSIYLTSQP